MSESFNNINMVVEDKFATIMVDRPERKNAVDVETMLELQEAIRQIDSNKEVLTVILTGSGDEAFISGGDLKYFKSLDTLGKGRDMSILCGNLLDQLEGLDIPIIGAINGYAFGGGCEFALACDYRIASREAQFGFRQIKMGIMTSWGGGKRLVRTVGKSKALMMMLTGDTVSAEEALSMGLVDRVVDKDEVVPAARELAKRISINAPQSIRFIKRFLNSCGDMSAKDANLLETEMFAILWGSEDHQEAVDAFFEKRDPKFKGR
jgi:enoyl-CoA hydratase